MIKEIVTHAKPVHLDELVAHLQLTWYGEDKFPGVGTAKFRAITASDNVDELKKRKDVILLGLGGSQFDEHGVGEEKAGECCATLVAQFLGLDQDFSWRKILKYVLHTDKNPPTLTLDLAPTVIRLQRQGLGLNAVSNYVEMAINAAYDDQKGFSQTSLKDVEEEELMINGQKCFIAVAKGDDPNISRYMRFFGATVVVVENSNGHIQVLTNQEYKLDIRDVLRILRIWEQNKNGQTKKVEDWKVLESEETIPTIPQWYYHRDSNNILNGGSSRPDVPATKLSLEEVVSAVRIGLESSFLNCNGTCYSTFKKPCAWYELGLVRCRRARYASKKH